MCVGVGKAMTKTRRINFYCYNNLKKYYLSCIPCFLNFKNILVHFFYYEFLHKLDKQTTMTVLYFFCYLTNANPDLSREGCHTYFYDHIVTQPMTTGQVTTRTDHLLPHCD